MKHIIAGGLLAFGFLAIPSQPTFAQTIDIGPGGVRVDPRSPRERERDEFRGEERREEFRDERRDVIRRERRLRRDDDDDD
ncbi:hypothetical protein [Methylobacterium persicinum]|uniref:Uncharacterized protein n=1 Tax=Methylobacterium persicinum TaxID=374426 RepID=A0ABU0HSX4_9HYPH|nr:hypothetical protein [Methylobacterium persicinum]MDQ0445448.1 hypothetical protein [Methylobacterium persicinum]GJE40814.1 hypothetical protein KHHGKMAE_4913 [Methylobacterium persicinum]